MPNKKAELQLTKARTALLIDNPFFGTLTLRLEVEEAQGLATAGTDGKKLYYNPDFINRLPLEHLKAVLAHEVLHVALLHHTRREQRDPRKWNIAADYAINPLLAKSGFTLPDGCLLDHQYADMATEEIYRQLPDDNQGQGGQGGGEGQDQDPGGMGGVIDAPRDGKDGKSGGFGRAEEDAKIATQQAAQAAKACGTIPAGIKRLVDEIINPKLPWQDILRRFVDATAKNDYTWSYPNRRHIADGLYLPSMYSEELGHIVLAVDTSGSIDREALNQFSAELNSILEYANAELTVIYSDSEVTGVEVFTKSDLPLTLHPVGGGGTDFRPAFQYVEDHNLDPKFFIYFTDMDGHFPDKAPDYPVLWAQYGGYKIDPPFGELMVMA
jgi:predicted metal-dependent peptidase